MSLHWLRLVPFLLPLLFESCVAANPPPVNYNVTGYDVAPDLTKYKLDPYPSMKDKKGKQIDAANVRGTRLFGWEGCEAPEYKIITDTYDDFYKLSHTDGLYKNFKWNEQASKEIWGIDAAIPKERKEEIRQIFDAASSIWYSSWQRPPWSPGIPGRDLWIHVRCSGGDGKGDPPNKCGDRPDPPDNPNCPKPENGGPKPKSNYEAYSDQKDNSWFGYSQITFCNRFFNDLNSLGEATKFAKKKENKENLENWNNRARVFFHEITHLAYFMNTPGKSPNIDDLLLNYGPKSDRKEEEAYGPFNVKVLRNYKADGWYAGQNADSFAWYAVAMWAKKQIGHYPTKPESKGVKPYRAPRRGDGASLNNPPTANDADDVEGQKVDYVATKNFTIPGCRDTFSVAMSVLPTADVTCADGASAVPSSVFSSLNNKVYKDFCVGATNNRKQLKWTSDIFGNLIGRPKTSKSRVKRLSHKFLDERDDGPEKFTNWQVELNWTPVQAFDAEICSMDCPTAFDTLSVMPACSQKGNGKNLMSTSGQIKVECGTYGYTVKGIAIS